MIKEVTVTYSIETDGYHDSILNIVKSLDIGSYVSAIRDIREYIRKIDKHRDFTDEQRKTIEEIRKEIFEITEGL